MQFDQLCRDRLGDFVHWGATTQDSKATADVLQIREAPAIVERELAANSAALDVRGWRGRVRPEHTRRRGPSAVVLSHQG